MELEKLDHRSRELLEYLNTNSNLTSTLLAEAFNQHYKNNLQNALTILAFLETKGLVKMKTNNFETAVMIQVTHSGQIYEQSFSAQEKERKKKIWSERLWNIITLILSAIISVILNLFMNMGG